MIPGGLGHQFLHRKAAASSKLQPRYQYHSEDDEGDHGGENGGHECPLEIPMGSALPFFGSCLFFPEP